MDQKKQLVRELTGKTRRRRTHFPPPPPYSDLYPSSSLSKITGVRLPGKGSSTVWDVSIEDGRISSIDQHDPDATSQPSHDVFDGANRLLAPSLCHAHIHLDKCFLLQDPKYSDLQIEDGDFQEAMKMTGEAKARFEEDDLLRRGRQLIEESIHHGVTAMRAFVEVDGGVQFKCLDAGLQLKEEFEHRCEVQICAFAQLPLFSGADGGDEVRKLMTAAAQEEGVDVLGSTPYVEADQAKQKMNVRWIASLALTHAKHLDLHLDYFLEEDKQPLVWSVLDIVKDRNWMVREGKHITLGHCTRLTRFKEQEWARLRQSVNDLPISFVGLPTSDLFMMRTAEGRRGTLPVVGMIQRHGLDAAIAINNVGNAFTPHGNCDPLRIASMGVGLYHAGAKHDAETLYATVSSRAKAVIGHESTSLSLGIGEPADFVLFDRMDTGWRCRKSIVEVVYDPADKRQTIRRGRVTAL
ncbi:cytosine deaminase protein-like protein [Byssothecium circinans]|uniref:Cytosine deaminase protein-like protein n=1 Tax=Byssothecium circinans TaxID=147558 RepID=A0A6A5TIJ3_9PLEO|nr:cytosine deaminase protein-like protein [Byssothecium circinans]